VKLRYYTSPEAFRAAIPAAQLLKACEYQVKPCPRPTGSQ